MGGSCGDVTGTRARTYSREDDACETPKEDAEAKRIESERAAEARRNAWASSQDERGGMSQRGASAVSPHPPSCDGPTREETERAEQQQRYREANARKAQETARMDRPLEDDPVGNAIPGLIVGGVASGVRAAATGVVPRLGREGAAKAVAHEAKRGMGIVGKHAAEHVAADAIAHGAEHGAHALGKKIPPSSGGAPATSAGSGAPAPAPAPGTTAAGRSGSRAVSEPADPPGGQSSSPPPAGKDRVPYAPGRVPLRIPEPPRDTIERPVVIAG